MFWFSIWSIPSWKGILPITQGSKLSFLYGKCSHNKSNQNSRSFKLKDILQWRKKTFYKVHNWIQNKKNPKFIYRPDFTRHAVQNTVSHVEAELWRDKVKVWKSFYVHIVVLRARHANSFPSRLTTVWHQHPEFLLISVIKVQQMTVWDIHT